MADTATAPTAAPRSTEDRAAFMAERLAAFLEDYPHHEQDVAYFLDLLRDNEAEYMRLALTSQTSAEAAARRRWYLDPDDHEFLDLTFPRWRSYPADFTELRRQRLLTRSASAYAGRPAVAQRQPRDWHTIRIWADVDARRAAKLAAENLPPEYAQVAERRDRYIATLNAQVREFRAVQYHPSTTAAATAVSGSTRVVRGSNREHRSASSRRTATATSGTSSGDPDLADSDPPGEPPRWCRCDRPFPFVDPDDRRRICLKCGRPTGLIA